MRREVWPAALAGAVAGCDDVPMAGATGGIGGSLNVAAYDEAVASLGCELVSDADYGAVEFQAGLNREQTLGITDMKLTRGEAERLADGGVRIIAGPCAA